MKGSRWGAGAGRRGWELPLSAEPLWRGGLDRTLPSSHGRRCPVTRIWGLEQDKFCFEKRKSVKK